MRFNIIGFDFPNFSRIPPGHWKHCVVHPGSRLIFKPDKPGMLMCPLCGTSYQPNDTISEERFDPSATPKTQTRMIQPKKKKKYYDKQGNEINDEQLLKDIANGAHVISYNEQKGGEERYALKSKSHDLNDEVIKSGIAYARNCEWFMRNYSKFREQYRGKIVAVYNQDIIDSDIDYSKLTKRLNKKKDGLNTVFKKYIPEGNGYLIKSINLVY